MTKNFERDYEKVLLLLYAVKRKNQIQVLAKLMGWTTRRAKQAFKKAHKLGYINRTPD